MVVLLTMPHNPHSPSGSPESSREVAQFWAEIRATTHETRAEATRQVLLAACPSVDAFSFELADTEEQGASSIRESPVVSVKPGTPRPVVES